LHVDEPSVTGPLLQARAGTAGASNFLSFNSANEGFSPSISCEIWCKGAVVGPIRAVVVLKLGPATRYQVPLGFCVSGRDDSTYYPLLKLQDGAGLLVYSADELRPIGNGRSHITGKYEVELEVIRPLALNIVDFKPDVRRHPEQLSAITFQFVAVGPDKDIRTSWSEPGSNRFQ